MRLSAPLLAVSLALFITPWLASAQDADSWPVKGRLDGKFDKAKDVSGIACMEDEGFPRHCLVIDDDVTRAQIVVVDDGKLIAGDCVEPASGPTPDGEVLAAGCGKLITGNVSLDGEGVAYVADNAGGGTFYVIGSHGVSRQGSVSDAAALAAASHLLAITVKAGQIDAKGMAAPPLVKDPADLPDLTLRPALLALKELDGTRDMPLRDNGLTIEGITIKDGTIYAGLRAPIFDGAKPARILATPLASPSSAVLHALDLGPGRGVRDLARYGKDDKAGILILAGPSSDPDPGKEIGPHDYSLYFWKPGAEAATPLGDVKGFGHLTGSNKFKAEKPEAILPLDVKNGMLRVLVLYDGGEEGAPRPIELPAP